MNPSVPPKSVAAERGLWVWIPEPGTGSMQLPELLDELHRNRWRLLVALLSGGIATFALSFLMPVLYQSVAVVVPAQTERPSALEGIAGQFGGLAGLAGVALPISSENNGPIAIATLKSRSFLLDFAKRHGVDRQLFARRFDATTNQWRPKSIIWGGPPTDDELMESLEDSVEIEQDTLTGLITIKVLAGSPMAAHHWGENLIRDLNEQMRVRDVKEAERAIEYLNERVTSTAVNELRAVFYRLIEDRMKTVMLAHVSPEYALRIIDPASTPDKPAKPRRWLLAALGSLLASVVVLGWILARFAFRPYLVQRMPAG